MAGIYLHIPFCRKACHYCNFHFSTSFHKSKEMLKAMVQEIHIQAGYLQEQEVATIYFGGGTPSAIPPEDISALLESIRLHHSVLPDAEITLEANPDDITHESLTLWRASGINRLSIGIQSFQDQILAQWNRSHTAVQGNESIQKARESGIENITADLIYGSHGLRDEDWIFNIQQLIEAGIPHISCYALTVETGTALFHQIQKGKSKAPEDEQAARQYGILQNMLRENGFIQYEVSNFAKPGFESRHNRRYWTGDHYLGIGPSAHSFNGVSRQWNVSHNIKYIEALMEGHIPYEMEILGDIQRYNEWIMTGLRTSSGIAMHQIAALGEKFVNYLDKQIQPFLDQKKIIKNEHGDYLLHPGFYFFADGIAAELFYSPT